MHEQMESSNAILKAIDLRTQNFKSEDPFLRDHYGFKTKIEKSESDSR